MYVQEYDGQKDRSLFFDPQTKDFVLVYRDGALVKRGNGAIASEVYDNGEWPTDLADVVQMHLDARP